MRTAHNQKQRFTAVSIILLDTQADLRVNTAPLYREFVFVEFTFLRWLRSTAHSPISGRTGDPSLTFLAVRTECHFEQKLQDGKLSASKSTTLLP
jgi:hypothetical protein